MPVTPALLPDAASCTHMASTPMFSTGGGGPGFCCRELSEGSEVGAQVTKVFLRPAGLAVAVRAMLRRDAEEAPPMAARTDVRGAVERAREKREAMLGRVVVCGG